MGSTKTILCQTRRLDAHPPQPVDEAQEPSTTTRAGPNSNDTYFGFIYGVALRAGLTETEALDAVQTTVITVQKKIAEFKYDPARGNFRGWLTKITKWRISEEFRKRTAARFQVGG